MEKQLQSRKGVSVFLTYIYSMYMYMLYIYDYNELTVKQHIMKLKKNIKLHVVTYITSKINGTSKGVRLSQKLQLNAALCNEI